MDVCDPTSSFYQDGNCDCSAFNIESQTGSIPCSKVTECLGSTYYGCYGTCVTVTDTLSFENGESIATKKCYEFAGGDGNATTTAQSSLCISIPAGSDTCDVQLDGQPCTSCTWSGGIDSFDCSNVVDGVKAETYNYSPWAVLPIIQACYKPPVNAAWYCNLCGANSAIDSMSHTAAIFLDGFGDAFTCFDLQSASFNNQISSDKCTEAAAVAMAECCTYKWYVSRMKRTSPPPRFTPNRTPHPTTFFIFV